MNYEARVKLEEFKIRKKSEEEHNSQKMKWPVQETMRRAIEGFLGGLIHAIVGAIAEVFIDMFLASLFVLSTATMAISSLACLTFGSPAAAMVFGIALLSITLAARSHSWGRKLFDPEVMDLVVAGGGCLLGSHQARLHHLQLLCDHCVCGYGISSAI